MKNPTLFIVVAVLPAVAAALAASSCDSGSAVATDASTHDGTGAGGQGTGGQGTGGAGGGTAGDDGGTAFSCGAESCRAAESYCNVVNILFLESGGRLSAPEEQKCVPFPLTCAERTDCSCFQPPASLCDGLDQSCKVTDSGLVTLTCTAGG